MPPTYATCPPNLGELLESHGRYVQSLGGSVRIGRRLQLEKTDFDAVQLRRRNLHKALLPFCRLSCSDLRESNFSEAELPACDLTAADLTDANFARADLRGADLSRAVLVNTKLNEAQLGPYKPAGSADPGVATRLHAASLKGASFAGAVLTEASFEKANLQDASFAFARLEKVNFFGADLRGADFALADMAPGMAEAVQAAGGKLPKPVAPEQLQTIVAEHQDWISSDGGRGRRAMLRGCNLANAMLAKLNLSGADLSEANLAGADLTGTLLICTDLRGANLLRVTATEADFRGALLEGSYGFTPMVSA